MPPIAVCQPQVYLLTDCHRGQAPSHIFTQQFLERERQVDRGLLALRQALLKLRRVMNQHILPGKRLGCDQA